VPVIPKIKHSYLFSSKGGPLWVTMTFDIRVSPTEVAKHYSEIRRKVFVGKDKPLTRKHEELALFVATRKDKQTWQEMMEQWNEKYPKWAYSNRRLFARDAKAAIQRIRGPGKVDFSALFKPKATATGRDRN